MLAKEAVHWPRVFREDDGNQPVNVSSAASSEFFLPPIVEKDNQQSLGAPPLPVPRQMSSDPFNDLAAKIYIARQRRARKMAGENSHRPNKAPAAFQIVRLFLRVDCIHIDCSLFWHIRPQNELHKLIQTAPTAFLHPKGAIPRHLHFHCPQSMQRQKRKITITSILAGNQSCKNIQATLQGSRGRSFKLLEFPLLEACSLNTVAIRSRTTCGKVWCAEQFKTVAAGLEGSKVLRSTTHTRSLKSRRMSRWR